MSPAIDETMFYAAQNRQRVSGSYYGNQFSGTVVSSRAHTISGREIMEIALDEPTRIEIGGGSRITAELIIRAEDIETGLHQVEFLDNHPKDHQE